MSMYSLFFANCLSPVNLVGFKIYGNAFKSLDLLIDEKSPKIHEWKLISTSFPVPCNSQFSCKRMFKCTEINSASTVKHNSLILLLELDITLQLSLNTSGLILLSSCGHFLTISHISPHKTKNSSGSFEVYRSFERKDQKRKKIQRGLSCFLFVPRAFVCLYLDFNIG